MDLEKTIKELSTNEKKVLLTLHKLNGNATPEEIFKNGDFTKEVEIMNASSWLKSKDLVEIKDDIKTVYSLGNEGKQYIEKGLPEKRALRFIFNKCGKISIKDLSKVLDDDEISVAIGWLKKNNWVSILKEKDINLTITEDGIKALNTESEDEKTLKYISANPYCEINKNKIKSLLSRKNIIKVREVITCTILLNDNGKKIIDRGIEIKDEISQITSEIIKNGLWKKKEIRAYDIHAFAPTIFGGKPHP